MQTHVSDCPSVLHWPEAGPAVRSTPGHSPGGQQAVPVRVPQVLVAGGGQSGPEPPVPPVPAPGLPVHRGPAEEASRIVRKSQANQQ